MNIESFQEIIAKEDVENVKREYYARKSS